MIIRTKQIRVNVYGNMIFHINYNPQNREKYMFTIPTCIIWTFVQMAMIKQQNLSLPPFFSLFLSSHAQSSLALPHIQWLLFQGNFF